MQKEMMLNRIPCLTWNRLKVNETYVTVPDRIETNRPEVVIPQESVVCYSEGMEKRTDIKTGMGDNLGMLINDTDVIDVPAGYSGEEPIVVRYNYADAKESSAGLTIHAGSGSNSRVILIFDKQNTSAGLSVHQLLVDAGDDAMVEISSIQLLGAEFTVLHDFGCMQGQNAQVTYRRIEIGGKRDVIGAYSTLAGKASRFVYESGYYLRGEQSLDVNLVARHTGKKTVSDMHAVGVLDDQARKLFRGTIDFVKGCAQAKGEETEDVLLLGDDVINQTVPIILCDEEDVDGSHGASIGKIDEDIMFYLGTRGISKEEAEQMMAMARIKAVCDHIGDEELAGLVMDEMEKINE